MRVCSASCFGLGLIHYRGAINDMEEYQKSFGMNGKGSSTGIVFIIYNVSLR